MADMELSHFRGYQIPSCLQLTDGESTIVFYGHNTSRAVAIWALAAAENHITNVVWDAQLESKYLPNVYDL